MLARRSKLKLLYEGTDISEDLAKDLTSFSYTDNASGNADDIAISISDSTRNWIEKWNFQKGDTFTASIQTENWRKDKEKATLPCGNFMVDEPGYSGRPSTVSLKGISVPANSNFMHVKRSKVWKKVTVKSIAQDVATRYGLQLFYDSPSNPSFKSKEQSDTADASFLQQLCEEEGLAFKLTDKKIIIFSESKYEGKKEVAVFKEWDDAVLNYSFSDRLANTAYAGVSLKYLDPRTGKAIDYLFSAVDEIDPKKSKIFKLNKRVKSLDEAIRMAKSKLRSLNKKETTGSLTLVGDLRLAASSTIVVEGFGKFDGKYYIDKAAHSVGSSGFTTTIDIHKVLGGY